MVLNSGMEGEVNGVEIGVEAVYRNDGDSVHEKAILVVCA